MAIKSLSYNDYEYIKFRLMVNFDNSDTDIYLAWQKSNFPINKLNDTFLDAIIRQYDFEKYRKSNGI